MNESLEINKLIGDMDDDIPCEGVLWTRKKLNRKALNKLKDQWSGAWNTARSVTAILWWLNSKRKTA